jgi:diaminopropionate ammonia-lyase
MSATGYLINKRTDYKPVFSTETGNILNNFDSAYSFHKSLEEYVVTPIIDLPRLAAQSGVNKILVKDEGSRFGTGAIKILGATYAINHFTQSDGIIGFCTATDGNHGRAVAWAAKRKGFKSVIFVPKYTSKSRIKAIEEEGGKVIICSGNYDQSVKEAEYFALEKNFKLIQDTAWTNYTEVPAYITAGYYTQLHEIALQTENFTSPIIDVIFLQAGVGSWPSAVVHYLRKYLKNTTTKIICIEPYESDCIYQSIKNESLATTQKSQKTIMAGLNCGTPSILAYEILKQGIDAFLLISDKHTIDAIKYLNAPMPGDPYIAAGESGAAGLAGFLALMNNSILKDLRDKIGINKQSNILVFNTENVTDPELTETFLS